MNTSSDHQDNLAKEPNAMEQEISHTRERIGRTVEELEQRLSPGQLVDQALGFARDHGGDFAANFAGSVRRNPLPLLLTGVGVLWLLKSQSKASTRDSQRDRYTPYNVESAGYESGAFEYGNERSGDASSNARTGMADRVAGIGDAIKSGVADARSSASAAGESVGETVRSAKDSLTQGAHGVADSARSATRTVREKVGSASQTAREQARWAKDEFSTLMEEQPLLMGAVGVAIGATIAALVPSTRKEQELLGSASDSVADKAGELASEGYETLRETATHSVDELTRSLTGKGDSDGAGKEPGEPDPASQGKSGKESSTQSSGSVY